MSRSYAFNIRSTEYLQASKYGDPYVMYERAQLNGVDEEFCKLAGEDVQETRFHWMFNLYVELGFIALMRFKRDCRLEHYHFQFMEQLVDKWTKDSLAEGDIKQAHGYMIFKSIMKMIHQKYLFEAWG